MASTKPARGTRDLLPADVRKRNYVTGVIREVYESYGYEPLETPSIENLDTLMGKYGEEGSQLIFKILKRGEKLSEAIATGSGDLADLALRYDLTVPLARVVTQHRNDIPKFFKRYQIQPVWRADRPARGRYREFYQCDVDAIGSDSPVIEGELITAVTKILRRLGFADFTIRLNHRAVLADILDTTGVSHDKHSDALVAIDKLDKIGPEGVAAELAARGVSESSAEMLLSIFAETQKLVEAGGDANRAIVANLLNIVSAEVLTNLGRILQYAERCPVILDPSLARGLSYYTGAIMEISVADLAGSLGGGGRYDGLIGMFSKEQIPACGFSLGLERILVVMEERGMFPPEIAASAAADVMVSHWDSDSSAESISIADTLRTAGLKVLVYPEPDKLGKQFKYADSIGIRFVAVSGETERAARSVKIKDLSDGEESVLTIDAAAGHIKDKMLRI